MAKHCRIDSQRLPMILSELTSCPRPHTSQSLVAPFCQSSIQPLNEKEEVLCQR